jgi:hypothetical protein
MAAERFIYALADWTVEKRESGWFFSRSANRHNRRLSGGAVSFPTARARPEDGDSLS